MKQSFTFVISLLSAALAIGQANLVVTTASFSPSSIAKGGTMQVQATVKNEGNATAAANFMYVYFTQDENVSEDEIVSRVSIQELGGRPSGRQLIGKRASREACHSIWRDCPMGRISCS